MSPKRKMTVEEKKAHIKKIQARYRKKQREQRAAVVATLPRSPARRGEAMTLEEWRRRDAAGEFKQPMVFHRDQIRVAA